MGKHVYSAIAQSKHLECWVQSNHHNPKLINDCDRPTIATVTQGDRQKNSSHRKTAIALASGNGAKRDDRSSCLGAKLGDRTESPRFLPSKPKATASGKSSLAVSRAFKTLAVYLS